MLRSDPRHNAHRCPHCLLPPRWCICEGQASISVPLQVDLLMHDRETERPTGTGNLIHRLVQGSRLHVWTPGQPLDPAALRLPDRDLWILHPSGDPLPAQPPAADSLQLLLIDGSWKQATAMMKTVTGCGRRVSLPLTGTSRYWLRSQPATGGFSTIEALLHVLGYLGLHAEQEALRLQFELHVLAVLCSRGERLKAADYLSASPVATAFPALVHRIAHSRRQELASHKSQSV